MDSTVTTASNNMIMAGIGIVLLAMGIGIGYVMFSAPFPANETVNATKAAAVPENFSINNSRVNAQVDAINRYYALIGTPVKLTANGMKLDPEGLIEVNVSNSNGNTSILYFTKAYNFVSAPPFDVVNYTANAEARINATKAAANSTNSTPKAAAPAQNITKADRPKVELYVMSYCPYGNQAEQGLYPVIKAFNGTFDFEPVYIISGSAGNWKSLHGASELNQDIRERIIYNLYGVQAWNGYVYNADTKCTLQTIDTCWKAAAQNISAINITAVEAQYNSSFDAIAKEMSNKTGSNRVSSSPTMLINGAKYSGGRTPDAYKAGICNAFTAQPSACSQALSTSAAATSGNCG